MKDVFSQCIKKSFFAKFSLSFIGWDFYKGILEIPWWYEYNFIPFEKNKFVDFGLDFGHVSVDSVGGTRMAKVQCQP